MAARTTCSTCGFKAVSARGLKIHNRMHEREEREALESRIENFDDLPVPDSLRVMQTPQAPRRDGTVTIHNGRTHVTIQFGD